MLKFNCVNNNLNRTRSKIVMINQKITKLFNFRNIEKYIEIFKISYKKKTNLMKNLKVIQYWIYILDLYGEHHWNLDYNVINDIWQMINAAINKIVFDIKHTEILVKDIKSYQLVEEQTRIGCDPSNIDIERFYYLKTCDVRLIRDLVSMQTNIKLTDTMYEIWGLYDQLGEVCDDLIDITEDKEDYNCNRFLNVINITNCKILIEEYYSYIININNKCQNLYNSIDNKSMYSNLIILINQRISEAFSFLDCYNKKQITQRP